MENLIFLWTTIHYLLKKRMKNLSNKLNNKNKFKKYNILPKHNNQVKSNKFQFLLKELQLQNLQITPICLLRIER